jgi:hypothetical protein
MVQMSRNPAAAIDLLPDTILSMDYLFWQGETYITPVNHQSPMAVMDSRGWVFYSLISLVALLWAGFIYQHGIMLWISFFITLTVLGVSAILLVFLILETRGKATDIS